jgi:hypothetical protein
VIGTGTGALPVMEEVKREAHRRKIRLAILPTTEAIKALQENPEETNAVPAPNWKRHSIAMLAACTLGGRMTQGSVATLQVARDRLAGCSSWPLQCADYSSGGNLNRK